MSFFFFKGSQLEHLSLLLVICFRLHSVELFLKSSLCVLGEMHARL